MDKIYEAYVDMSGNRVYLAYDSTFKDEVDIAIYDSELGLLLTVYSTMFKKSALCSIIVPDINLHATCVMHIGNLHNAEISYITQFAQERIPNTGTVLAHPQDVILAKIGLDWWEYSLINDISDLSYVSGWDRLMCVYKNLDKVLSHDGLKPKDWMFY